jgi:predicted tellurium resistance membrane protein TerC
MLASITSNPDFWLSLLSLTLMEIVLGIDNVVFISIVVARLKEAERLRARSIGLFMALGIRILLLFVITWFTHLTEPLFNAQDLGLSVDHAVGIRDLILLAGGIFLIYSSTNEIYEKVEHVDEHELPKSKKTNFMGVVFQVIVLDIVFSADSILTAVGLSNDLTVMITAVVISLGVMLLGSGSISRFIEKHPSVKILALSFLLMIGLLLVAESFHAHVPKGYVYAAMAFSLSVELLNLRFNRRKKLVRVELPAEQD